MGTMLVIAHVARPVAWIRAAVGGGSGGAKDQTSQPFLPKFGKSLELKDSLYGSTTMFNFTNYPGENTYTTAAPTACGPYQENTDYFGNDLGTFTEPTPDACCARCQADPTCMAWVWGQDQCYIKGGVPESALVSEPIPGLVAGRRSSPQSPSMGRPGFGLNGFPGLQGQAPGSYGLIHAVVNAPNTFFGLLKGVGARAGQSFTHGQMPVVPGVGVGGPVQTVDPQTGQAIPTPDVTPPSTIPPECAIQNAEQNADYPGNDINTLDSLAQPEECCSKCLYDPRCVAWTFSGGKCFLKGSQPRLQLTKVYSGGSYAGRNPSVSSVVIVERSPGQSLYCWALTIPFSYEKGLLAYQYQQGASLFSCDEYAVYSNQVIHIVPDFKTVQVDVDLHCERGGEFGTALNTDIFMTVWSKVFQSNRWRLHDWTVKVDPDAVFFPVRLRQLLTRHPEEGRGVYINNCNMGMHGPLEVFSRNAVQTFWSGRQSCIDHFRGVCQGDCDWGEDMFIDQCLSKVLAVKRAFDGDVLLEDHCNPPPDWRSCTSPSAAAFHPYKDINQYQQCLVSAQFQLQR
jgi:hypothetical protein